MLPDALLPLAAWPQFVGWRIEPNEAGELTKILYNPRTGGKAIHTNPSTWTDYETARRFVDSRADMVNVGFVFSANDPFFFLDIDNGYDGSDWSPIAKEMCSLFSGAAVEVSQSGKGLHVIGRYGAPLGDHGNKIPKALGLPFKLELYTKERFVALTGTGAVGSADTTHDAALSSIIGRFFTRKSADKADTWTTAPVPEWSGPTDDVSLLELAMASGDRSASSVFAGEGVSFRDLWEANADALSRKWPSAGRSFDASSADQALANMLAYWTGKDCERMERLMRASNLMRGKWDNHGSYLTGTILRAVGFMRKVLQQSTQAPPPPPPAPAEIEASGFKPRQTAGVMLYNNQLEHFKGCVYISSLNKVLTPDGDRLDQARFDVVFGGYSFILDVDGEKKTTSAWEAFTRNQVYAPPTAHGLCFRPELPPGKMALNGNRTLANLYVPVDTPCTPGDASPFLNLVAKMLPDERDQRILLTYLAALKQKPGAKFQWWPVIQGIQGNGKTFFLRVMAFAIGDQYTHLPNTDKMVNRGMSFNGWIEGKLFLGLEEVYGSHRREFFEGFKTTVTSDRLPIEAKGVEEITSDNRANGIITTNHKDGVPIKDGDRRYAIFFTAQQSEHDLFRDGMIDGLGERTSKYFADLYDWAKGAGAYVGMGENYGYRVINHHLSTMALAAEFDPTGIAQRAPLTSSTREAVETSLGRLEQEIKEAIEEGRCGFVRPWVSSTYLSKLCDDRRMAIAPSKRREIMLSLGYDWHPCANTAF